MWTLTKKELTILLCSPIATLFLLLFVLATGLINWHFPGSFNITDNGYANLNIFFQLSSTLFLIIIPALTMRSFSEEKKDKTLSIFHSRPTSIISLYLSKLAATWIIIALAVLSTTVYIYSLYCLSVPVGNIDINEIIASYISLLLLGFVFINIGLFTSSLTNNQIIAFLTAIFLNFTFFYGFDLLSSLFASGKSQSIVSSIGLLSHNKLMNKGVIKFEDLLTLFNYISIFSILTIFMLSLKNKKAKKNFSIAFGVLFVLNILSLFIPNFRLDFTSDKRYTLSEYSKQLLKQTAKKKTPIHFDIYLEGDLNLSFQHLQNAMKDMLVDFKRDSQDYITFDFVNPYSLANNSDGVYSKMSEQNMKGIALNEIDREGKRSQKIIYPYAQVYHGKDTLQINLLKNIGGYSAEENLNASIENLEFEFIDAIRLFHKKESESIAFIEGHGELLRPYVYDAEELLSKYFSVNRGQIGNHISILDNFKVVIIAGPTNKFSEQEKYIIDQYIMSGGRVLWLIDGVYLSLEDLANNSMTTSIKNDTNLDDLLFTYGIRINPVLLQDLQCTSIVLASENNQYSELPWHYSILTLPSDNHPITKDIPLVKAAYSSSIDIINHSGLTDNNILLTTSMYSRIIETPKSITLDPLEVHANEKYFKKSFLPIAVSLEGIFNSAYKNRLTPDSIIHKTKHYISISKHTKMIVISSSDIIRNDLIGSGYQTDILPMGYDRISNKQYGNRDFIVNAVNWLANDDEWLLLRTKKQQLRLLNKQLIYSQRNNYTLLNIGIPVLFILLVVAGYNLHRKRKYEK